MADNYAVGGSPLLLAAGWGDTSCRGAFVRYDPTVEIARCFTPSPKKTSNLRTHVLFAVPGGPVRFSICANRAARMRSRASLRHRKIVLFTSPVIPCVFCESKAHWWHINFWKSSRIALRKSDSRCGGRAIRHDRATGRICIEHG
jgi:hypothetical protein